jgi:hypothetical protein
LYSYNTSGQLTARYVLDSFERVERIDTFLYTNNQLSQIIQSTYRNNFGALSPPVITGVSDYNYSGSRLIAIKDSSVSTTGGARRVLIRNFGYSGGVINIETTYEYLNGIFNRTLKDSVTYSATDNSLLATYSMPSLVFLNDEFFINQPKLVERLFSYQFDSSGNMTGQDVFDQNELYSLENGYVKTLQRRSDVYYTITYDCH